MASTVAGDQAASCQAAPSADARQQAAKRAAAAEAEAKALEAAYKLSPTAEAMAAVKRAAEAAEEAGEAAAAAEEAVELLAVRAEEALEDAELRASSVAAVKAAEAAYMGGGCAKETLDLIATASAEAIYRCHCAGGLVVAIDQGCTLICKRGDPSRRRLNTVRTTHAQQRDARAATQLSQWPSLLPYYVGLKPPYVSPDHAAASDRAAWRRMRGAVLHAGLCDCSLGFCAVGLPPGSVLCALPQRRFMLRSVLGSREPIKLSHTELREADLRRTERERRRKADAVRCAILERMREAGVSDGNQGQPEEARHHDWMATKRGACGDCNECAGFVPPLFPGGQDNMMNNALIQYCFGCGCTATAHAQVDRKA